MKFLFSFIFLFIILSFNFPKKGNHLKIIATELPLNLNKLDFNLDNYAVSDGKESTIKSVIEDFYFNECKGDSAELYFSKQDVLFKTIRFHSNSKVGFLILLFQKPFKILRSKLIFIDIGGFEIIGHPIDFNLHPLYHFNDGKIEPSNLKTKFKINTPEISLVDFDNDGKQDFKLSRLYHNGTSNAIEEMILSPNVLKNKIDTLHFNRKWIFSKN